MLQIPKIEVRPYLDIALRRKWWIIVPLILALIGGGVYALTSKKMYRASTLILIEGQRIPSSYVSSSVTESQHSRLRTISKKVTSRTNLEKLIKTYDLDQTAEEKNKFRRLWLKAKDKLSAVINRGKVQAEKKEGEDSLASLVRKVRGNIHLSMPRRNRSFSISFTWDNPEMAARIVNSIASQFIEENLKVREEMAMGTTSFLGAEAKRLEKQLTDKEKALAQFKREHMGTLPDQLDSNLNILSQLKEDLNNFEKRIETAKQQAMMIENQMQNQDEQSRMGEVKPSSSTNPRLKSLQNKYQELKNHYTEQHPDVVALKRRIENLKNEINEAGSEPGSEVELDEFSTVDLLKEQLKQVKSRIDNYEEKVREIRGQINEYRERVEKTPQVRLALRDLQRDYGAIKSRYHNLVSKKLEAQVSEELEKRQKGEQLKVVDPAVPPGSPYKPDIKKIMLMALLFGLGFGGGLAFVRESLDPAFYTPEEVEDYLGIEVMVSLPFVEKKKEKEKGMSDVE